MYGALLLLFILAASGVLAGESATLRHNAQITYIKPTNKPHPNKRQHSKLHKQVLFKF
jgi:hypothetical protein